MFSNAGSFIRLWRNEVMRIFHDRLISAADKAVVLAEIKNIVSSKFSGISEAVLAEPILFGHFKQAAALIEDPAADVVLLYQVCSSLLQALLCMRMHG